MLALFSASKGINFGIQIWGQPYWLIDYGHGLIRRGLVGTLCSFLFDRSNLPRLWNSVLALHLMASIVLLTSIIAWLRRVDPDKPLVLCAVLFLASQFPATLFYNTGYLDVYIYVLAVAGAYWVARGQYVYATCCGFIGPFLHESFFYVWLPILVFLLLDNGSRWYRFGVLLSPVVATIILYFGALKSAAVGARHRYQTMLNKS